MSVFIELLRQYRDELEQYYRSQLTDDIRQAIAAMLRCQTEQQERSQWFCPHCHHDDLIDTVLNANTAPHQTG